MRIITHLIFISILFSCQEKTSNWENSEFSEWDYEPNTLRIENYSVNNIPFITNEESLRRTFGEATTINELKNLRVSPNDSIDLRTLWFLNGELVFDVVNDTAVINSIDLHNADLEIKVGKHVLSSDTRFKDMKELFPKSYAWRNPGLSNISWMMDEETPEEITDFDWIHISDGKLIRKQYGYMELSFINQKLAFLTYSHGW